MSADPGASAAADAAAAPPAAPIDDAFFPPATLLGVLRRRCTAGLWTRCVQDMIAQVARSTFCAAAVDRGFPSLGERRPDQLDDADEDTFVGFMLQSTTHFDTSSAGRALLTVTAAIANIQAFRILVRARWQLALRQGVEHLLVTERLAAPRPIPPLVPPPGGLVPPQPPPLPAATSRIDKAQLKGKVLMMACADGTFPETDIVMAMTSACSALLRAGVDAADPASIETAVTKHADGYVAMPSACKILLQGMMDRVSDAVPKGTYPSDERISFQILTKEAMMLLGVSAKSNSARRSSGMRPPPPHFLDKAWLLASAGDRKAWTTHLHLFSKDATVLAEGMPAAWSNFSAYEDCLAGLFVNLSGAMPWMVTCAAGNRLAEYMRVLNDKTLVAMVPAIELRKQCFHFGFIVPILDHLFKNLLTTVNAASTRTSYGDVEEEHQAVRLIVLANKQTGKPLLPEVFARIESPPQLASFSGADMDGDSAAAGAVMSDRILLSAIASSPSVSVGVKATLMQALSSPAKGSTGFQAPGLGSKKLPAAANLQTLLDSASTGTPLDGDTARLLKRALAKEGDERRGEPVEAGGQAKRAKPEPSIKTPSPLTFYQFYAKRAREELKHAADSPMEDCGIECPREAFLQKPACKNKQNCYGQYGSRHVAKVGDAGMNEFRVRDSRLIAIANEYAKEYGGLPDNFKRAVLRKKLLNHKSAKLSAAIK